MKRSWFVLCVGAGLLTGCSAFERGYPDAPVQQTPPAAAKYSRTASAASTSASVLGEADPEWLQRTAKRTRIPQRALAAYTGVSLHLAATQPECRIGWNTLAGIGEVESKHGTYDKREISDDGVVAPAIIGVPLDGSEGVMEIRDTDSGEYDGDREWDRAVGPMQFIPTTWEQYAQDGDGDGYPDPHQIDDAALSAAHYLCQRGGDLGTNDGWAAGLAAYNQSASYARKVAAYANRYAD